MIPVRVWEVRGTTAIVELAEDAPRWIAVPVAAVQDNQISERDAALGIEYGLPYERLIAASWTPESMAEQLRRRGFWTVEDLERGWTRVQRIFAQSAYQDAANMLASARRER